MPLVIKNVYLTQSKEKTKEKVSAVTNKSDIVNKINTFIIQNENRSLRKRDLLTFEIIGGVSLMFANPNIL